MPRKPPCSEGSTCTLSQLAPPSEVLTISDQALILTYFRDNGQAGVFLATSDDGHRFTAVNGDQPVFTPPKWPNQSLTRDPSIVFHKGVFHMDRGFKTGKFKNAKEGPAL